MNTRVFLFIALLALVFGTGRAVAADSTIILTPEAAFRQREQTLAAAIRDRDRDAVEQLVADDFVMQASGELSRKRWIERSFAGCAQMHSSIGSLAVRVDETLAVVTFVMTLDRDPASCDRAVARAVITDVWTQNDDDWQLASRQAAPLTDQTSQWYTRVPDLPPVWFGNAQLSYVSSQSRSAVDTLGAGADVTWKPGPHEARLQLALIESQADGTETAQSATSTLRYAYAGSHGVRVYSETGYRRDRFAGIEERWTANGGVGSGARLGSAATVDFDGGVGVVREQRVGAAMTQFTSANASVKLAWKLPVDVTVSDELHATADVGTAQNWRAAHAITLAIGTGRLLGVQLSHNLDYLNVPVPGFPRVSGRTAAAVVFRFRSATRPPHASADDHVTATPTSR